MNRRRDLAALLRVLTRLLILCAFSLFNLITPVHAEVSLPNGEYSESLEEFRVQALGGPVRVTREYLKGRWQINSRWNALSFNQDVLDGSVKSIEQNGTHYTRVGDVWTFGNRRLIRAQAVSVLTPGAGEGLAPAHLDGPNDTQAGGLALTNQPGYHWFNRNGDWIDYDASGKMVSYGDKNDLRVWIEYGSGEAASQIQKVRDHFGRTLLTYTWANGQIVEIKDNPRLIPSNPTPARTVRYQWNGTQLTQATDVLGTDLPYTYEHQRLTKEINPENRTREITYGPTGRVASVKEADGSVTSYAYDYDKTKRTFYARITYPAVAAGVKIEERWFDKDGNLIRTDLNGSPQSRLAIDPTESTKTATDSQGRQTVTTSDQFDNVIKTTYPDGSETKAKYSSAHGGVLEQTDELGFKTTYDYDAKGNRIRKTEAVGIPEQRTTEWVYNPFGQLTVMVQKGGTTSLPDERSVTIQDAVTRYVYDTFGNLTQTLDPENNQTQIHYNHYGQPIQVIDPRGNSWKVTYDAQGNEVTRTNPLGKTSTTAWNKAGERVAETDAENNTTRSVYNARGRLIETVNPLSQRRKLEIDLNGQLIAQTNPLNQRVRERDYNLDGKLLQEKDGNNNIIAYDFGASGSENNLLQRIRYPSFTQGFVYDNRNQLIEIKLTLSEALVYNMKQTYTRKGQISSISDANGKVQRSTYDALGRLSQVTDPLNGITMYRYDQRNNRIAVIDTKGNITQYRYDRNNRPIQEIRPLGQMQQVIYDEIGNPVTCQDAKGNTLIYTYDATNRQIGESRTPAGAASPQRVIAYTYNTVGTLTGYTDNQQGNPEAITHRASYILDALQRRIEEKVTYGEQTFSTKISYSPTGQKASVTSPSGTVTEYTYDTNQNLATISLPTGSYSLSDRQWNTPKQLTVPGGSVQIKEYDPLLRTTRIKVNTPSQSTLMDYQYTYDPASNITQKSTEHGTYDYQYDDLYRLTTVSNPWGMSNEAWSYDALGNRKTDKQRGGSNPWQVNANNQITKSYTENNTPITPVWDENGSLIEQQTTDTAPELNQSYRYDAQNRLIEVRAKDGQRIASYQYDPFGRRIAKTTNEGTTYFLYTDDGLIAEASANGTITTEYGWKPGSPWSTDPLSITTTRTGGQDKESFAYQNDHLGTPQKIIDRQGQVVWEAQALAFGETKVQANATITNNLRFPGQYFDAETKTHYNFFRDYDPAVGRYRQSDPIGLAGGINIYVYVEGDPISYIDPTGEAPGDKFTDMPSAVADARRYVITQPKYDRIEYGFWFFKVDSCYWTYNIFLGEPARVPYETSKKNYPFNSTEVGGHGHTHPGADSNNPLMWNPSDGDVASAKHWGVPGILFSPDGSTKRIDPNSGKVSPYNLPKTPRRMNLP